MTSEARPRCQSLAVLIVLILLGREGHAAEAPPSLDKAVARARNAGLPLVLEFSAIWCKPCALFEREILPDASVQEALKGVIFVRYDGERAPGSFAAARLGVRIYPTFVVMDGEGRERLRQSGAGGGPAGVHHFLALLAKARGEAPRIADGAERPMPARAPAGAKPTATAGSDEIQTFLAVPLGAGMHVGQACSHLSEALDEVYVRLILANEGGRPKQVVPLEPGLPPALRTCLIAELSAIELPRAPEALNGRVVMPVSFRRRLPTVLILP